MKKGKTIKAVKPVNKKPIVTSKRSMVEERARARRTKKLLALGVSQKKIDEIIKQEDVRMVYLIVYDGDKPNETQKQLDKLKLDITGNDKICWSIKTDKDSVAKVVESIKHLGRTTVFKPKKFTIPEIVEVVPGVKVKKPTNNTSEVKQAAKKARKTANLTAFKGRKKRLKTKDVKFKAPGKKVAQNANKQQLKLIHKVVKKAA